MRLSRIVLVYLAFCLTGCQTPPVPPEIKLAGEQEQKLWRAGASVYASPEYEGYLLEIKKARRAFEKENLKLGWFRRYDLIQQDLRKALSSGDLLFSKIQKDKEERLVRIQNEIAVIRQRLDKLDDITLSVNERGKARRSLSRAEIKLNEARLMASQSKFKEAALKLDSVRSYINEAENACLAHVSRYMDKRQIETWKKMAAETIEESRIKRITVIIVDKLEKKMTVYKRGTIVAEFDVGLGLNGLSDKLHSGDNATPEGRYKITKKNASSQFYKALMINYPNEEDLERFAAAKRRREIPYWVGIGGLVEIHGGGKDSLTRGCVSMDDKAIDHLFDLVSMGTPITIVGTLDRESSILKGIKDK